MNQSFQSRSAQLSAASLLDVISQGEGAFVEFKSSFQKEVIETLTSFANTQGGTVLMGVSDAGQIVGVAVQAETVQGWINQCKQITSPRVIPDIELVQIEGKTVAIVSIGEYPIKPVACKGRYFKHTNKAYIITGKPRREERWDYPMVTVFRTPEKTNDVGVNVGVNGLLLYIQTNPGQRAGDIAMAFKLTQRTIERWLKQYKENDLIEFRGAPKTGGYYCKNT